MNNSFFGKTMENVRNYRDIRIVTTNKQRNKLVSGSNYHTMKHISKNLLIIEMKKTEVKMSKPIYLDYNSEHKKDIDNSEHKKAKGTKKCVIKGELMFENYKDSLFNDKIISKSQQRFKSDHHKVCTEEINKIA